MITFAFDTETFLLNQRGKATTKTVPRLVCLSYASSDGDQGLLERERACPFIVEQFARDDLRFVGHNVPFDLLVVVRAVREDLGVDLLPRIFELYNEGRIEDTLIREQLYDISRGGRYSSGGGYGLADLVKRRLGKKVEGKSGPDVWRLRYNELDGIPSEEYPKAAYEYALLDAVYTLAVFESQPEYIPASDFQSASDFVLSLISAWGVRIDADWAAAVDGWYARLEDHAFQVLIAEGLALPSGRVPKKPKERLIQSAYESFGLTPPLTKTGQISTAKDTLHELEELGYSHPAFRALIDHAKARKYRATYLEPMLDAADGNDPLCGRYNCLVDSTRTSASNPNLQNVVSRPTPAEDLAELWFFRDECGLDAEGNIQKMSPLERLNHPRGFALGPDIRGSIVPREGNVIIGADYAAIEMAGLAQVIYNLRLWGDELSPLAKSINAGEDQHVRVVAAMRESSYEACLGLYEEYNEAMYAGRVPIDTRINFDRFTAKSANYSFPVGAAASTWADNLRKFGVHLDDGVADRVRAAWYDAWPEMREFHAYAGSLEGPDGMYEVPLHGPGGQVEGWVVRKTDRFTSAANSLFQSIVACGAKLAMQLIAYECYVDRSSDLYGCRQIIFEHDANYLEAPEEQAPAAATRLTELMVSGMKVFIPDVLVEADADIYPERWTFK